MAHKHAFFDVICKIDKNQGLLAITASFSDFIKIKKELKQLLDTFQRTFLRFSLR